MSRGRTLRRVARLAGSAALLALTAWWVDVQAVAAVLSRAQVGPIVVALVLSVPLMLVLAGRWHFTCRRMDLQVSFGAALREYYASTMVNQLVPGGVVGDIGRAVRAGRDNPRNKGAAARSVVLERASGQLVLWALVVVAVGWRGELGRWVLGVASAVVVLTLGVAWGLARWLPEGRVHGWWTAARAEMHQAFVDRGAWAVQLGLSSISLVLLVAMYAACLQAVGASLSPLQLLRVAPLLFAVVSLPVSVGGWGIREATSLALFELEGLDPAAGVAASAAFGAVNLLAALPGVWTLLHPPRAC